MASSRASLAAALGVAILLVGCANRAAQNRAIPEPLRAAFPPAVAPVERRPDAVIISSVWDGLAQAERDRLRLQYEAQVLRADAYGAIVDVQGVDRSTPGTTAGAHLGGAIAGAAYLDRGLRGVTTLSVARWLPPCWARPLVRPQTAGRNRASSSATPCARVMARCAMWTSTRPPRSGIRRACACGCPSSRRWGSMCAARRRSRCASVISRWNGPRPLLQPPPWMGPPPRRQMPCPWPLPMRRLGL